MRPFGRWTINGLTMQLYAPDYLYFKCIAKKRELFKSIFTTLSVKKRSSRLKNQKTSLKNLTFFVPHSLERAVFFLEQTKVLMARKFVNAQFVVPYPQFAIHILENLDKVARELQNMWKMATYRCKLSSKNTSENDIKVDWLLKGTKK